MAVIVVPDEVADNVASTTPVRQKAWIGYLAAASKEHRSLNQAIPKVYATVFKMCTHILVTKLEGENGYPKYVPTKTLWGCSY